MRLALAVSAMFVMAPAALAAPPDDTPVATVSTAPVMSVSEQIDHYLRTSPVAAQDARRVADLVADDSGRRRGEVSVAMGTGGYRSFYARTDISLGEESRLSLAIGQSRFADRGVWWSDPASGAYLPPYLDRQRCDLEAMTPERPLDRRSRSQGRCQGAAIR